MNPTIIVKRSVKQNKRGTIELGTMGTYVSFSTHMTIREFFKACNRAGVKRHA